MTTAFSVGVISAPRPTPTLESTLQSLARAGWPNVVVFRDGDRRGPLACWKWAVEILLTIDTDINWLLICEDDIEVTPGLRWWLQGIRLGSCCGNIPEDACTGVLSLYCQRNRFWFPTATPGWRRFTPSIGCGALAYVMSRSVAKDILWCLDHWPKSDSWSSGPDHAVAKFCRDFQRPYYIHSPPFIRHTGTTTSLRRPVGDERFRNCHSWVERFNDDGSMVVKEIMGSSGGGSEGSMASESASVAGVAAASEPGGEPGNHI